ncbi:alditol oxidase [Saccharothrix mutabilis subsp. mutabilis]|uniref:Alditol oxidase n=1 Tax=Saccharothrix mutabilis subsp. mutabilis TaxID=66855 RepID=A0ABN0TH78_9PSEU
MTTNWAGSFTFTADRVESPTSVDGVRRAVAAAERAHVLGAGHSFSRVADTTGTLIRLDALPEVFDLGPDTVRVSAGTRLAGLAERLHAKGFALPALPSLPHVTVAGAVATGTHGSGDAVGTLADLVRSLDLVTADGDLVTYRRGEAADLQAASPAATESRQSHTDFDGVVVSLGALGVVVALELAVVPTFDVEQRVVADVPLAALVERFDDVFAAAHSVSAFTTWDGTARVWVKRRVGDPPADLAWTGGHDATAPLHPVPGRPAHHCTAQLGEPGPWHERLPHFRADFTPSVGRELQSEYFVPREHAAAALAALARLDFGDLLLTSEIRTIAADQQWLSPTSGRASAAFHFTWRQDDAVHAELARIEDALAPWRPRAHWGKLSTRPGDYPGLPRFARLRAALDPAGKFRNATLDGWLSPAL